MKFLINLLSVFVTLSFSYQSKAAIGAMDLKEIPAETQHILPKKGDVIWVLDVISACTTLGSVCIGTPHFFKAKVIGSTLSEPQVTIVKMLDEKNQSLSSFSQAIPNNLLVAKSGCAGFPYCVGTKVITAMGLPVTIVGIYSHEIVLTYDRAGFAYFYHVNDLIIE